LKDGLAAIKENVASGKVVRPAPSPLNGSRNRRAQLISTPYFTVDMFELREPQAFHPHDQAGKRSVQILVATEGCGAVEVPGTEAVTLAKGDAVVIPASLAEFQVRPQWTVEFLKASLPGGVVGEPATRI